ncbi:MAG: hypothetical protein JNK37_09585 [Verrucomicrobiales bacterium]|nr:hypothetical protein [Verrucomicrobiales bacterium]
METEDRIAYEAASLAAVEGELPPGKRMMDFLEGDTYDGIGRRIEELILKTDHFIVFLDEFGSVQWGGAFGDVDADSYDQVSNRVAELEIRSFFLRHGKMSRRMGSVSRWIGSFRKSTDQETTRLGRESEKSLFAARRLIAEGMARLLSTNSLPAATGILDTAEKWISQRSIEYSRRWLLVPFGLLSATCLVAFFILMARWGSPPEPASPQMWLLGALLGGVGALVSYVSFNRQIPFDATAGRFLHNLEALLRWFVGVVSGFTVQLLI